MILISGVSGGVGSFLAKAFVAGGAEVWGLYNSTPPPVIDLEYRPLFEPKFFQLDLRDPVKILEFVEAHKQELQHITFLHCAGVNYNSIAMKLPTALWDDTFAVNTTAAFVLTKALLPFMREENWGRIIYFGSVVPQKGVQGTAAYAASKAALWGLAKTISMENCKKNITCNVLNLGYFNIGMIEEVPDVNLVRIVETIPAGRLGEPYEILHAVNFLRDTPYVTGTTLDISGGLV